MKFIVLERSDRVVHLACEGKLTPSNFRAEPLAEVLGPARPGQSVLLDLSRTDYINSTGISWLIQVHKQLSKMGGVLILHSMTPLVRDALDLVQLSSVLKIATDYLSAVAALDLSATAL